MFNTNPQTQWQQALTTNKQIGFNQTKTPLLNAVNGNFNTIDNFRQAQNMPINLTQGTTTDISQTQPQAEANAMSFKGSDWANVGLGIAGLASNLYMGSRQLNLAEAQQKAEAQQRAIENQRYNEQRERHIQATNDAVNASSALKSAQANFNTKQNAQAQNTQNAQQAQNTESKQEKELPMQRE